MTAISEGPGAFAAGTSQFRTDINGLRAVAVLLVLLFHFGAPGFSGGFIGVDVFFVISGFLMTKIALDGMAAGTFSIAGFYYARLARIYPALVAMVGVVLALGFVFVTPAALMLMAKHAISALLFISNVTFWREAGYFDLASQQKWFLHTWSLAAEWQFYLAYPVLLALVRPLMARISTRVLVLGGLALGSLALAVLIALVFPGSGKATSFGFYMLPTRAWEMLAGGLIACAPALTDGARPALRRLMEAAGLAMIAASVLAFSTTTIWPAWNALLPVAGVCLVLAARVEAPLTGWRPLQVCGATSYSLYLWHWPVVVALAYFDQATALNCSLGFALSLLLGWLSFRVVETPTRRWLKALGRAKGSASSFAVAGAVGALAVAALVTHGLPERVRGDRALYADAIEATEDRAYPESECGGVNWRRNLRPCTLGAPSASSDVAVIGDSFAEMWFARAKALAPSLTDHAVVFYTHGGCPAVPGFRRLQPGFNCGPFGVKAFEAARDPRFGTVVIASMWPAYFLKGETAAEVCVGGSCAPAGVEEAVEKSHTALVEQVRALKALGKRVVVLTTSPYPSKLVPYIIARETFAGEPVDPHWSFDFGQVLAKSLPIEQAVRSLKQDGAEVVDLTAQLCGQSLCAIMRDGAPIYADAEHLRASFAARAGAFLDPYFLGRPPADRQANAH